MRKCHLCEYRVELADLKDEMTAIAEHYTVHNPSPARWTEAYQKIQAGRQREKQVQTIRP